MGEAGSAVWVAQLELGGGGRLEGVVRGPSDADGQVRVLVRLEGNPLGFLEFDRPAGEVTSGFVTEAARGAFGDAIRAQHGGDGVAFEGPGTSADEAPAISVVVCTRNRAELLGGCLGYLQRLNYGAFEVVVVDNAPDDDAGQRQFEQIVGDDARFRYVREPVPGLSRARNRGLAEASFTHVAFTDDDCIIDPGWLHGIARGFGREPAVACVTGIAPAACLDTPAQRYFDRRVSWSSVATPRIYDLNRRRGDSPMYPFNPGAFGGVLFGVDRDVVVGLGGFDEALGAGSPSCGGEDLEIFVRIVRAGHALAFEPSAIVWHIHRSTMADLNQQMRNYGVGLGAFLLAELRDRSVRGFFARQAPRAVWHMARSWAQAGSGPTGGTTPVLAEIRGLALSPLAYHRARTAAQKANAPRA